MPKIRSNKSKRVVRHKRVRRRVQGDAERPRMSVYRSLSHVYVQVVDDTQGVTLAAASSLDPDIRGQKDGKPKAEVSKDVGKAIAQRAREKGIKSVVFDRGGFKYHGRVKALADAAREGGLVF